MCLLGDAARQQIRRRADYAAMSADTDIVRLRAAILNAVSNRDTRDSPHLHLHEAIVNTFRQKQRKDESLPDYRDRVIATFSAYEAENNDYPIQATYDARAAELAADPDYAKPDWTGGPPVDTPSPADEKRITNACIGYLQAATFVNGLGPAFKPFQTHQANSGREGKDILKPSVALMAQAAGAYVAPTTPTAGRLPD